MKQFDYTGKSKFFAIVSVVLILAGIVGFIVNKGISYGIEFTGGTTIQIDMQGAKYDPNDIQKLVKDIVHGETQVQSLNEGKSIVIKTVELGGYLASKKGTDNTAADTTGKKTNSDADKIFTAIEEKYGVKIPENDRNVTTIGEATSKKILSDSMKAVVIAVILMLLYITVRFEVLSGVAAVAGLIHNILIMLGFYAIFKWPINNSFVAAILTIVGYSINNTIVIFDRVRENVKKERSTAYAEIANVSISQTFTRTLNSSITTLLTIGMVYILGVSSIKEFALPIIIGIIAGTYASIYLCAPLWVWLKNAFIKRKKNKASTKNEPGKKKYQGAPKKNTN
ncbi:MAG: protein translocase subunit SecF [Bacillota bacterium]|nr:protein translocase subunit SecF [Bacillota bacterium]